MTLVEVNNSKAVSNFELLEEMEAFIRDARLVEEGEEYVMVLNPNLDKDTNIKITR